MGKRVETRVNVRLLGAAVRPEIRIGDGTARTSTVVHPTSQKRDVGHPATPPMRDAHERTRGYVRLSRLRSRAAW